MSNYLILTIQTIFFGNHKIPTKKSAENREGYSMMKSFRLRQWGQEYALGLPSAGPKVLT